MYSYRAYGLIVYSPFPLPELITSCEVDADVIIQLQKLEHSPLKTNSAAHCFQLTSEGMYLYWQGVGTFLIQDGKRIIIDPVPEADEDRLRLFILGAAIGVLLHQRGYLVLHASAVTINDSGVAFIGDKGWGKSTMVAALHARGHSLIGDDVIAVDLNNSNQVLVIPAFPQLKLWPDAVAGLGGNPEELPRLVSHLEKRDRRITHGFTEKTIPLQQIYVLGIDVNVEIQPLQPQKILTYLFRNSYITRFGNELLQPNGASHFLKLTKLANLVSISRLLRPSSLQLLPNVCQLVEQHFERQISTANFV
ncbi:MAG: hypothetical protein IGS49_01870 [Chlorogloeopsis fritschii C42_A2020_084]|uniref:serine kinase n=1 Tax=Chlorogloeopsis fritschii TaxID=1124 RepID=UPI001A0DF5C6|nr:serine kinase [Chlorogloeopsis fritschii]MBF2004242.1 hypothetical protein [Chlorogloeopsis fritschii C42_A2020_084]